MKALLLCGGEGTRLRPFTHTMPKQLFPLANKPILFYILDYIARSSIRDVVIIVGHNQKQIKEAVGTGAKWGLDIKYLYQPQPLGLAHAVLIAKEALGQEPFLMYLGDNLLEEPLSFYINEFIEGSSDGPQDGMILVRKVKQPWEFGVAEIEKNKVLSVVEKPKEPKSDMALVGIYFFSPEIHKSVRNISPSNRGELEITDAIQDLINRGKSVGYKILKGWWKDTGSPEELLNTNKLLLKQVKTEIFGRLFRSHTTGKIRIGKDSVIENSWIKGPVCIGSNCHIKDAILGPFLSIGDKVKINHAEAGNSILLPNCRIENLSISESILGEGSSVYSQTQKFPKGNKFPHHFILGADSIVKL